ncbi:MAG: NAD-dependent deacylase [Prevotellaceae bacterium]|jgi:NAD-dependent deacetylase|nr:NAD-dependent deacylase [Prevotellaceae bacterium]
MKEKKNIVVLTGAGISAESGIKTFRDSGGLWEEYDISVVASIDGWHKNPDLVQEFYNKRRKELEKAEPNDAHKILAKLEEKFNVEIITQNVDNLHERGGSSKIIHLHGELTKARSSENPSLIYEIGYRAIQKGEKAGDGSTLRPHIVWFGEAVPMIETAVGKVRDADIIIITGTSLNVYPAAGLIEYARPNVPVYIIDPNDVHYSGSKKITFIKEKASSGMKYLYGILTAE